LVPRRRCMALAPVQRKEAGARDRVLITDKCRGPCGGDLSVHLLTRESQYESRERQVAGVNSYDMPNHEVGTKASTAIAPAW
jgi:hypothetical protein